MGLGLGRAARARHDGLLLKRMDECVDGEYQNFKAKGGAYVRKDFFGKYPELLELVERHERRGARQSAPRRPRSEEGLQRLQARREHQGTPTVILAKTVKGYGLGEAGEGRNATHQQKKLNEPRSQYFRKRFDMPYSRGEASRSSTSIRPADGSVPKRSTCKKRRSAWADHCRCASPAHSNSKRRRSSIFKESLAGSGGREASTTIGLRRMSESCC